MERVELHSQLQILDGYIASQKQPLSCGKYAEITETQLRQQHSKYEWRCFMVVTILLHLN